MIFNNVLLHVIENKDIPKVKKLLAEQARRSSVEPGCKRFEVYHSKTNTQVFMLVERWVSQQHLDDHKQAAAFQELYIPEVIPLVSREPHPCDLVWPDISPE
jgi:quinol monooxygenase YgiN